MDKTSLEESILTDKEVTKLLEELPTEEDKQRALEEMKLVIETFHANIIAPTLEVLKAK